MNTSKEEFVSQVANKKIQSVSLLGKWIFIDLDAGIKLALCFGMGGDVFYHESINSVFGKYQFKILFEDASYVTIKSWWFGHFYLINKDDRDTHKQILLELLL